MKIKSVVVAGHGEELSKASESSGGSTEGGGAAAPIGAAEEAFIFRLENNLFGDFAKEDLLLTSSSSPSPFPGSEEKLCKASKL